MYAVCYSEHIKTIFDFVPNILQYLPIGFAVSVRIRFLKLFRVIGTDGTLTSSFRKSHREKSMGVRYGDGAGRE
jgi:hypothetical protein